MPVGVSTRNIVPLLYGPNQVLGNLKAGKPTAQTSAGAATSRWAAGKPTTNITSGSATSRWKAGKPTSLSFDANDQQHK